MNRPDQRVPRTLPHALPPSGEVPAPGSAASGIGANYLRILPTLMSVLPYEDVVRVMEQFLGAAAGGGSPLASSAARFQNGPPSYGLFSGGNQALHAQIKSALAETIQEGYVGIQYLLGQFY